MRKVQKGQAKTSLKELLAQHPEPLRNDWSNGRPAIGAAPAIDDDGFPVYDPKAFESSSDEEESGPNAGGAFAVLATLNDAAANDDNEWKVAKSKSKKKAETLAHGPSTAAPAAAPAPPTRRPAPASPATSTSVRVSPQIPAVAAPPRHPAAVSAVAAAGGTAGGAGPSNQRAPYSLAQQQIAPSPRPQRSQTHDAEGRPVSDTYYQSFQKVYRNEGGAVCLRFHKTDVVVVERTGNVVLNSGGFKTRTTFLSVQEGLQSMGLRLTSTVGGDGRGDWLVELPDGALLAWEDGMEVPAMVPEDRRRGERLLAAYHGEGAAATGGQDGRRAGAVVAGRTGAADLSSARTGLPPASASAPSAWSYRSAAGTGTAYTPPLRAPVEAQGSGAGSSEAPSVPLPPANPTPRTAASASELAAVLDEALALQGGKGAEVDDEFLCIACMAAPKNTVLIPCGHVVLCRTCVETVMQRSRECPMCREALSTHLEVSE